MMAEVRATALVNSPFSVCVDMLADVLRDRKEMIVSPFGKLGERVTIHWAITDDVGDEVRRHEAITLEWKPDHPGVFPSFRGTLTTRPHLRKSWLRISGEYEPPFGRAGRLFDRIVGRVIAWMTLRQILRELRRLVELRYLVYLQEIGASTADRHTGRESNQLLGPH